MEGDAPLGDKRPHLRHRIRRGTEIIPTMHQRHRFGDIDEVHGPVQRGVAAAGDHKPLAGERVALAHRILHRAAGLEIIEVGQRRALRYERPAAGRDHHDGRVQLDTVACRQQPAAVIQLLQRLGHLPVMENGIERGDLFHQPVGQLLTGTDRQRRNVVDRLLRIELGALAARLVEDVDKMASQIEKAQLEDGEQAAGACPDNNDVGFLDIRHD